MRKTSHMVEVGKFIELLKDSKWVCLTIMLFLMTFRISCNNSTGYTKFGIGCVPLRVSEIKEIVK